MKEIVDSWTTDEDVERTKPHPDVVHAALEQAGTEGAVLSATHGRQSRQRETPASTPSVCSQAAGRKRSSDNTVHARFTSR